MVNPNINHLRQARDKIATVYKDEVEDNIHDNGNLSLMTEAITRVEDVIAVLEKRDQPP